MKAEQSEFLRRTEELAERCERSGAVVCTGFLTPAEALLLHSSRTHCPEPRLLLHGGTADSERKLAFFLPEWTDEESFCREELGEYLAVVNCRSFFGAPAHRDYLGALLGLGLRREVLGDIVIDGEQAWIFCRPAAADFICAELTQVGCCNVRAQRAELSQVTLPEKQRRPVSFTVMSLRLDAVCGGMFSVSRTTAAELIREGAVSLNYRLCIQVDAAVEQGAVISVRGRGKGVVAEIGGRSKKDRLFVTALLYV